MAAKIFNPPSSLKLPELDFKNMVNYNKEHDQYLIDLKNDLTARSPNEKNVGEIIKFQVADGYAMYMVATMKPLQLIHIPLGDAWNFEFADLLTAKRVQEKIDQEKALKKLFG